MNNPIEVVRSLCAVQAQDYTGAKWALGMRCNTTDEQVTRLFNEGKILRTHILRPTWHFVAAEDLRWLQAITKPRVHAINKYYYKKLGLDEPTIKKTNTSLVKALSGGNHLTKVEIGKIFEEAGLGALALGYVLIYAELEAIICSGVMKGKQQTYALVEERIPQTKPLSYEDGLLECTRRFFTGHGPAQIKDFAWWASLPIAEVKKGIELAQLKPLEVDSKTYFTIGTTGSAIPSPVVHLLPNYDEYFISYKDREAFSSGVRAYKVLRQPGYEDLFYHLVALDGQLVGGWKRQISAKEFTVTLNLFTDLTAGQEAALQRSLDQLQDFVGLPVQVER